MSQFGAKNVPWGRAPAGAQQLNPQLFTGQLGHLVNAAQQFATVPQAAAMQLGAAGLGLGGGVLPMNAFSQAPQTLAGMTGMMGPAMAVSMAGRSQVPQQPILQQQQTPPQQQSKSQRAFVGVVTKMQENYGFVDDDVFFQTSVVRGAMPRVGDRVMVEASFNQNMPFKWNAFRIQLLPNQDVQQPTPGRPDRWGPTANNMSGPPIGASGGDRDRSPMRRRPSPRRSSPVRRSPPRRRSGSPRRHGSVLSSHSVSKRRSSRSPRRSPNRESPPVRKRPRLIPRYSVQLPKVSLNEKEASVLELKKRYANLYVPSDFFHARFSWLKTFPVQAPFSLDHSATYHVMHRDVDCPDAALPPLDPPDADHRYCAKVMLLGCPGEAELWAKALGVQADGSLMEDVERVPVGRSLGFLVGLRGKSEVMAIGGAWSASLDGADPVGDPRVLINTAIRTTRALTGVDLSGCTQWYKFLELRYRRVDKERSTGETRVDTVVVYFPDIWSVVPTKLEFEGLQSLLRQQLETKLAVLDAPIAPSPPPPVEEKDQSSFQEESEDSNAPVETAADDQAKPTYWGDLDIKSMKVTELRRELTARGLDSKGVKSVLVARLQKIVQEEREAEEKAKEDGVPEEEEEVKQPAESEEQPVGKAAEEAEEKEPEETEQDRKEREEEAEREKQKKREKEEKERKEKKASLERHYVFPPTSGLLVYPHKTAKSGKFDCKLMTLSSLLDYRQEDNKEHSFEVALFAETFMEMISRDCAFRIYKTLLGAADKDVEKKEKKEAEKEKEPVADEEKEQPEAEEKAKEAEPEDMDTSDSKETDKETPKKEEKKEKSKRSGSAEEDAKKNAVLVADPGLLLAFSFFDQSHCGYLFDRDMEEILYSIGLRLSRAQVHKLLKKLVTRDTLNYRKLTDTIIVKETKEIKSEPKFAALPPSEEIATGNNKLVGERSEEAVEKSASDGRIPDVSQTTTVVFRGSVVDVAQILTQLTRLEQQQKAMESRHTTLEKEFKSAKDTKESLEKKKRRLDDDVEKYKKRLYDAEKCLKTSQDDTVQLKTALQECKKMGEKMGHLVDKVLPTPSKEDKRKTKKEEKKTETTVATKEEEVEGGAEAETVVGSRPAQETEKVEPEPDVADQTTQEAPAQESAEGAANPSS